PLVVETAEDDAGAVLECDDAVAPGEWELGEDHLVDEVLEGLLRGDRRLAEEEDLEPVHTLTVVERCLGEDAVRLAGTAGPAGHDLDRSLREVGFARCGVELPLPRQGRVPAPQEVIDLPFRTAGLEAVEAVADEDRLVARR